MICNNEPKYSKGKSQHEGGMRKRQMGTHLNSDIDHIDEQPPCVFTKAIPIKKGEEIYIKSDYDFTTHEG
jgi:hypothetical protein